MKDLVKGKSQFILFHAHWCSHCQNMMKAWKQAASDSKNKAIVTFVEVEHSHLGEAAALPILGPAARQVNSFPTLMFYVDDKFKEYQGERTFEAFSEALKKMETKSSSGGKKPAKASAKAKKAAPAKKAASVKKAPAPKAMRGGSCGCAGMAAMPGPN
jgi:hypothetical protein